MADCARQLAEHTTFQAFINCYLREVDPGQWVSPDTPSIQAALTPSAPLLQLRLPRQKITLLLAVPYRSRVGRHHISAVFLPMPETAAGYKQEGFWSTLLLLVKELFYERNQSHGLKHRQLELTHRLTDSLQNTIRYLDARWQLPYQSCDDFISAEQSLLLGHWLHPTPKSRQGILDWQHEMVTPELQGEFQMHYFVADRKLVEQDSLRLKSAEDLIIDAFGGTSDTIALTYNEVLLPAHPLQAQWLLTRSHVQQWIAADELRYLGPRGQVFTATSSVRSVYQRHTPWMYKVSLPVKITNSLRQNKTHELRAGVLMADLIERLGFSQRFKQFQLISDPAYLTLRHPELSETGFETILRDNPFGAQSGRHVYCMAALVQDTWHPDQAHTLLSEIIYRCATQEQRPARAVAVDWFDAYWQCAIEPCIRLYDQYGIALEAHQQNSLLRLADGYPKTYYYRDNQGFYLDEARKPQLLKWQPKLDHDSELFYATAAINDRFGYYLLINQLFAVIYRLGADGIISEDELINILQQKLTGLCKVLTGSGKLLVETWLTQPLLPAKANLLTRVEDIDELEADLELAAYSDITNPLCAAMPLDETVRESAYV
ncbi:IucA/IucC family protein [Gilvimarinus agarilyticus]|uniref:IucA/IucC family protein n=1 Tax=Gilvimarinus agarilyticus TaxID=679259 RepID=UPI0005A2C2A5|nr:IucA/IucC family protein [Gilvimarinus agarilyticus]